MKNKKAIEEEQLDKLLNDLFIEENSIKADEASVRFIFEQEYAVTIDKRKEKQLLDKLNKKGNKGNNWVYYTIIIFTAIIGIGYFINSAKKTKTDPNNHSSDKITSENIVRSSNKRDTLVLTEVQKLKPYLPNQVFMLNKNQELVQEATRNDVATYYPIAEKTLSITAFFNPSEKEYLLYAEVKKRMLEKIATIDKGLYSAIEEGKITYKNKEAIIDPFILRNQAITNLEYKVFLAALIKNGQMLEYAKATVKSDVWKNYSHAKLAVDYFTDSKYNDFPIVNISAEGAILFCNWLEKEINLFSQQNKSKSTSIRIRLPFDTEWIFATRRGYVHLPDCGGYNTIYDKTENIVDDNYIKRIALIKKRDKNKITELDQVFATNRYGLSENEVLQLFAQGTASKSKLVSDSLYPSKMDVYSKVAHVSEIIYSQGTTNTVIIGSCWKSKQEYLQMENEFKNASASPYVGFRIVLLNDNKASYKSPFW
jgi:hypothetical protein